MMKDGRLVNRVTQYYIHQVVLIAIANQSEARTELGPDTVSGFGSFMTRDD